ncbi:MAG: pyridoxamine 5'-phosphate oxidase family protein [Thermodesulfobacteriota bacterium]
MGQNADFAMIRKLLDDPAHLCTLSTVAADGTPNSAVFGSVRLKGEYIVAGLGANHTLRNLQQNPFATLILMVPGDSVLSFRGIRLYLKCVSIETGGSLLEEIKSETRAQAGRAAAQMLTSAITFSIRATRPLLEMN